MISTAIGRGAAILLLATIVTVLPGRSGVAEGVGRTASGAVFEAVTATWRVAAVRPEPTDGRRSGTAATLAALAAIGLLLASVATILTRRRAARRLFTDHVVALGWSERAPPG